MTRLAGRCHCGVTIELAARDQQDHKLCATGEIPADPFCPGEGCGARLTAVALNPDAHLRCFGLRWCGVCHEVARYVRGGNGRCSFCQARSAAKSRALNGRKRGKATPGRRARERQSKADDRRAGAPAYEREKERKRRKYATDPAWAEAKRQAVADAYARAHPEAANDGRATLARAARGTLHGNVRRGDVVQTQREAA